MRHGTVGIVGRQRRVVRLGHAGDEPELGDAARVADVRLQDVGGALFQDLAESPLGEDALARRQRDVGLGGDLGHHVHVERLHDLLVEPGIVGFQRLDQEHGRRRLNGAVEVQADVDAVSILLAQRPEVLHHGIHESLAFDVLGRRASHGVWTDLHGIDAGLLADLPIDSDAVAGGSSQQLVDRDAVDLSLDVPERLIDPTQDRRLDGAPAVEGAAMDGLPVVHDPAGILAHQIVTDLQSPGGAGLRVVLEHLAPTHDTGVGGDLDEDPGVGQHEGLDLGHFDLVVGTDGGRARVLGGEKGVETQDSSRGGPHAEPIATIHSMDNVSARSGGFQPMLA